MLINGPDFKMRENEKINTNENYVIKNSIDEITDYKKR